MKKAWLTGTVGLVVLAANPASAQEAEAEAVDLGDIEVVETTDGERAPPRAYESFDPVDTGTSTLSAEAIEAENQGDIDTTELIRKLPNVQLSLDSYQVSDRDIQNLRPSDFVISGGNYYDNNILFDGVQANAIGDVTNTNAAHYNEVAGQTAQTFYVDPSLIGEISVRDSNVSAEYGDFTGGVVEYTTRKPSDAYHASLAVSYQDDRMVTYRMADEDRVDNPDQLEPKPDFDILRYSLTADLPVTDEFSLLLAYTRAESTVSYEMSDDYGAYSFENSDVSENFLVKGVYALAANLTLEGQVSVSPYRSEYENSNRVDDRSITHSDGLSAYLKLHGDHAGWDWQSQLSYSESDASRDWSGRDHFSWPSDAPSIGWCSSTNCSSGGFGDLDQTQEDLAFNMKAERFLWDGLLRFGGEVRQTDVEKIRPEDYFSYSRGTLVSPLDCQGDTVACIEDEVYLTQYQTYGAYEADVSVGNEAFWAEYERDLADVTLRGVLRVSHDDFLDNTNLAPRLTASWQFRPEWFLTVGANRYYANNMVAYAVRSQYPDSYRYNRYGATNDEGVATPGEWDLVSHRRSTDYAQADLDTPYSDELTAALTIPTPFNGNFRLKGVHRDGKDQFARSPSETVPFEAPTATSDTTRVYTITNAGESEYESISAEWSGSYRNHSLTASMTWSETHRRGGLEDYFDEIDGDELQEELLYYQGDIITEEELYDIANAEDFATPFLASAIWTSKWFDDRLNTTVGVYYRGEYETIEDTYDNIDVEGISYDVYEKMTIDPYTTVNLNAALELFESQAGRGVLDVRVENLFEDLPYPAGHTGSPYQKGRTVWLGFNYRY